MCIVISGSESESIELKDLTFLKKILVSAFPFQQLLKLNSTYIIRVATQWHERLLVAAKIPELPDATQKRCSEMFFFDLMEKRLWTKKISFWPFILSPSELFQNKQPEGLDEKSKSLYFGPLKTLEMAQNEGMSIYWWHLSDSEPIFAFWASQLSSFIMMKNQNHSILAL